MGYSSRPQHQAEIQWLDEIDSTNAQAARDIAAGYLVRRWLLTHRQTAGRGRQNRAWASAQGNFMGSYVWPIGPDLAAVQGLSLSIGLAVRDAILRFYSGMQAVTCKWPNDIFIGMGKAAGILIETHSVADGTFWGVVGIGVNLVPTQAPDGNKTGYLLAETETPVSAQDFFHALAPAVEGAIAAWPGHNKAAFAELWAETAFGLGGDIELKDGRTGVFEGIDLSGHAVVSLPDGAKEAVQAGDLRFVSLGESS
ncbi:MAG: biotin--[acetyl-CoA-carboxylase] ligase [Sphingomonadales bacterium]